MICKWGEREFYFPSGTCYVCGTPWIEHKGNLFAATQAKYGRYYEHLSKQFEEEQQRGKEKALPVR
jgi:hypothetical protein